MDDSNTRISGKKRKAADMERLSGKLLVDTYSKRSQTLIEKGKELEKLTGAYVVIYTARPESVVNNKYRHFVSDNLSHRGGTLAGRISSALKEIDGIALEAAHISHGVPSRKKPRATSHEHTAETEQEVASVMDSDASLSSECGGTDKGVVYEDVLGAASARGQETVARLLLDHGAGAEAGGRYNVGHITPPHPLNRSHDEIVKLSQPLVSGTGINAKDLFTASEANQLELVTLLLVGGADANAKGRSGKTALYAASKGGHELIVRLLLASGADVNAEGEYGETALEVASEGGHERIVSLLLDNRADVNAGGGFSMTALYAASERGHVEIVRMLLGKGANIHAKAKYRSRDRGDTALEAASKGGHEEIVRLLLAYRADVNAEGRYGKTALFGASKGGHTKIIRLLLDSGADVNAEGEFGETALGAASDGGHAEVVKLLLVYGADVDAEGRFGKTALLAASERGHEEIVKLLLAKGANINAKGVSRNTELEAASKGGHDNVVRLLLDNGAHNSTVG